MLPEPSDTKALDAVTAAILLTDIVGKSFSTKALKEGVPEEPFGDAYTLLATVLIAEKAIEGVVVGFVTETVNNGLKLPELTLVTEPEPPPA
jgi:hypothetical protein